MSWPMVSTRAPSAATGCATCLPTLALSLCMVRERSLQGSVRFVGRVQRLLRQHLKRANPHVKRLLQQPHLVLNLRHIPLKLDHFLVRRRRNARQQKKTGKINRIAFMS